MMDMNFVEVKKNVGKQNSWGSKKPRIFDKHQGILNDFDM